MSDSVSPFRIEIPEAVLDDLRLRLRHTRWPERETVDDWSQGVPLAQAQALRAHWLDSYDWRRCEAMLNGFSQFRTRLDDLGIHFIHQRSPEANALPLIMTHGWPGSIIEFHKVIGPLTDPVTHGGRAEDAFHIVVPSIPGYGFSDKPTRTGWTIQRIGRAWIELMRRLGYQRFVAQGGDWGSAITTCIAQAMPPELLGIHLNMVVAPPSSEQKANLTEREKGLLQRARHYRDQGSGYAWQQSTRPQTLGYALTDSPMGQATWIYEKFHEWTDCDGDPRNALSLDEMLDNIMLYWLPGTGASSGRLYWESFRQIDTGPIAAPVACSIFPKEITPPARAWAERKYDNITYWNELEHGGHFAAFEQPEVFVNELRQAFRPMRQRAAA